MAKRPCSEVEGIRTDGAGCSTQALATSTVQLAAMLAAQGSLLRSGDPWYVSVFLRKPQVCGALKRPASVAWTRVRGPSPWEGLRTAANHMTVAPLDRQGHPAAVPVKTPIVEPLSEGEYLKLAVWLQDSSPFDMDGVFGLLHAVAVAPSLIPPSSWLSVLVPNGVETLEGADIERVLGMLLRLFAEVQDAVSRRQAIMPDAESVTECESFAVGYVAGAALDPEWIGDSGRWSFAAPVAYLAGRLDLVPGETITKIEREFAPDPKAILLRDLGVLVRAAAESFEKLRRAAARSISRTPPPGAARTGRNEPCPCGSGNKYKRCCLGATAKPHLGATQADSD